MLICRMNTRNNMLILISFFSYTLFSFSILLKVQSTPDILEKEDTLMNDYKVFMVCKKGR